ncbi:hypothetical protein J2848_006017 [Azospirillum lipoferum]|uniref:DUF4157 domain-containing protein n=1 Tax=Azospirillum lipoferum TaxID=193 RepID=A0A5A9GE07_AZOLI|nr:MULTISPECIES: DUF4157 domain-containing protein [Azospirillum]KAA0592738.1 DUF4157 domain-containing protein [Azospirillum lipoferum]MCP1614314.1 hypothetical protein [Azospirillum lipoferum]MDW5531905.1 DUF4157 domain-containing protein [Azospirillum sp. NL1]
MTTHATLRRADTRPAQTSDTAGTARAAGPQHAILTQLAADLNARSGVRQFADAAPGQRTPAAGRNRTGLPDTLKAGIEALSGVSLDDVRVYRNSPKPAGMQALAYTQGTDIHVGPGQEQHLPHEAWHAVQQKQGRVRATTQMKNATPLNDDAQLEREADVMGAQAVQMMTRAPMVGTTDAAPLRIALPGLAVVQRKYAPTRKGEVVWVKPAGSVDWVKATFISDDGRAWNFRSEDGGTISISNRNNISQDNPAEYGDGNDKETLFDQKSAYSVCQHPDCGKKYKNWHELYRHVRTNHDFPKQEKYPYALLGGQGASSYVLNRNRTGKEWSATFHSKKTGNNMHSEWNGAEFLPRKKVKLDKQSRTERAGRGDEEGMEHDHGVIDHSLVTSSFQDFMDENGKHTSFFYTGEPHCGLCSLSLQSARLPTVYPTEAEPSQSQSYRVPWFAPNMEEVAARLGSQLPREGNPLVLDKKKMKNVTKPRIKYNRTLKIRDKSINKTDKNQQKRYILQSIALNKKAYEDFFSALGEIEGPISQQTILEQLAKTPVPMAPDTFDQYDPLSRDAKRGGKTKKSSKPPQPSQILTGMDGQSTLTAYETTGDGSCGIHAMFGTPDEDGCYTAADAPQRREALAQRIETGNVDGGRYHLMLSDLVEETVLRRMRNARAQLTPDQALLWNQFRQIPGFRNALRDRMAPHDETDAILRDDRADLLRRYREQLGTVPAIQAFLVDEIMQSDAKSDRDARRRLERCASGGRAALLMTFDPDYLERVIEANFDGVVALDTSDIKDDVEQYHAEREQAGNDRRAEMDGLVNGHIAELRNAYAAVVRNPAYYLREEDLREVATMENRGLHIHRRHDQNPDSFVNAVTHDGPNPFVIFHEGAHYERAEEQARTGRRSKSRK